MHSFSIWEKARIRTSEEDIFQLHSKETIGIRRGGLIGASVWLRGRLLLRHCFESFDRFAHGFGGNGEPHSLSRNTLGRKCHFGRAHPDQPAGNIDHWTARISRINRRVGLQKIFVLQVAYRDISLQSTEHAATNRAAVTDRIAKDNHGLAEKVGRRIIQINERESALTVDFDEREILFGIARYVVGVVNLAVAGRDFDSQVRCTLYHVLISHDVTGRVNDEARAKTLQTLPNFAWLAAVGAEKFRREIFEWIADLPAHYALSINVNDRRHHFRDRENNGFRSRVGRR